MLDAVSLTTIIMAALALIGSAWSQVKHCKSGCCECDKDTINKKESELKVNELIAKELKVKNEAIKNRKSSKSE